MTLINTLDEALASIDADLAVKRGVVAEREVALEAAKADVAKLELSRLGIEAAKEHFGLHSEPAPESGTEPAMETPTKSKTGTGFSPSAIIEHLIKESGRTRFTNEDVNQMVEADGHHMTRTQVSNALTYLSRPAVNFVRKAGGRGNWELVQPPAGNLVELPGNTDDPAEARSSDDAPSPLAPEVRAG